MNPMTPRLQESTAGSRPQIIYVTMAGEGLCFQSEPVMKNQIRLLCLLLMFGISIHAAETTPPASFSTLAANANLVAVTQVKDTDYIYTRSFPSEGSAFLKVLIAYKPLKIADEIIEVYEKGLHPRECYFESPTVYEEGRRYLVFLRRNPDDPESYRGLEQGCALEILVTEDNSYALKYPLDGILLKDKLGHLAVKYDFRDNNALVPEESLSPVVRDTLLASGLIIPYQEGFKYTHGIDLTVARGLITAEALQP
jgi:hypothetical protein